MDGEFVIKRGMRMRKMDDGSIQVYARRRDKTAHLSAATANNYAWRLVFELTPKALETIYNFAHDVS